MTIQTRQIALEQTQRSNYIGILKYAWMPIAAIYASYLYFIVASGHGAVDFETFRDIGRLVLNGKNPYVENSFYPMPTNYLFAFFAWLPPTLSILIWHTTPVLTALAITRKPIVLLFAPLFAHFLGGQTAIVGMIGLWGYLRFKDDSKGGAYLSILLLKPQLGLVPIIYAALGWHKKRGQAIVFALCSVAIYLPSFLIDPSWFWRWLHNGRDLRPRAIAGLIPRAAIQFDDGLWFWVAVIILGGVLLLWLFRQQLLTIENAVLWSFVALPFLHDYDLIMLIPILGSSLPLAVVLSIPTWLVIVAAYNVDIAWSVVAIIAAGLLWYRVRHPQNPLHKVQH